MPAEAVLRVLKMTRQEWGQLPPENETHDRRDLRKKANELLKQEAARQPGLHARLDSIEQRLSHSGAAAGAPNAGYERRIETISTHISEMERKIAGIEEAVARIEKTFAGFNSIPDQLTALSDRITALEPKSKKS